MSLVFGVTIAYIYIYPNRVYGLKKGTRMQDKAMAMVWASFAADTLALGAHWIYSIKRIARDFGRIETFRDPVTQSYHAAKHRGDFTHYGDQAFVLLESLAARGGFDPQDFSRRWQALFKGYTGYFDQATKSTLENLASGTPFLEAGSTSNDLAGAAMIAPLAYRLRDEEDRMAEAARTLTTLTHNDTLTVDAAEFFARVSFRVLHGARPVHAVHTVIEAFFKGTPIEAWTHKGLMDSSDESPEVIKTFGQDCHSPDAFPSVIHLISRYEDDLKEALVQNVMSGGDSAARGMAVGMVLGAHLGMPAIPENWIRDLNTAQAIQALLEQMP